MLDNHKKMVYNTVMDYKEMRSQLQHMKTTLEHLSRHSIQRPQQIKSSNEYKKNITESILSVFSVGFVCNSFKLLWNNYYKDSGKSNSSSTLVEIQKYGSYTSKISMPSPISHPDVSGIIASTLLGAGLYALVEWMSRKRSSTTKINTFYGSLIQEINDLVNKIDNSYIIKDGSEQEVFNSIIERYSEIIKQ